MTQYINLVNPAFRPRREPLSMTTLAASLAAICVVLAAAHFYVKSRADEAQRQLAEVESQLKIDQEKLTAIGRTIASARMDPNVVAEIESTRETLRLRDAAMAEVASGALGDTSGFSEQFRAFARQTVEGLWLTGFSLSGAGKDIVVHGRALSAERVPAYIRRLSSEPAFRGKSLDVLMIEEGQAQRDEKAPRTAGSVQAHAPPAPYLEFQLVSSAELASRLAKSGRDLTALRRVAESRR